MAGSADSGVELLSADESLHYFACGLRHVVSLEPLGSAPDRHAADLPRRHVDLAGCLANGEIGRATYDLRIISRPDRGAPSRGQIAVALIGRIEGLTAEDAGHRADEVLRLMEALVEEYDFELAPADGVEALLRPFVVNNVVGIQRRASMDRLDTLQDEHHRRLSFLQTSGHRHEPDSHAAVLHVAPYLPNGVQAWN
jgi:hypothetical protein